MKNSEQGSVMGILKNSTGLSGLQIIICLAICPALIVALMMYKHCREADTKK